MNVWNEFKCILLFGTKKCRASGWNSSTTTSFGEQLIGISMVEREQYDPMARARPEPIAAAPVASRWPSGRCLAQRLCTLSLEIKSKHQLAGPADHRHRTGGLHQLSGTLTTTLHSHPHTLEHECPGRGKSLMGHGDRVGPPKVHSCSRCNLVGPVSFGVDSGRRSRAAHLAGDPTGPHAGLRSSGSIASWFHRFCRWCVECGY